MAFVCYLFYVNLYLFVKIFKYLVSIPSTASKTEIRKRYIKLAKQCHPDVIQKQSFSDKQRKATSDKYMS